MNSNSNPDRSDAHSNEAPSKADTAGIDSQAAPASQASGVPLKAPEMSSPTKARQKPRLMNRLFGGAGQIISAFRTHPIWGSLVAIMFFVVSYLGTKGLDWTYQQLLGPDDFLAQMAENSKREFADIKASLSKLDASIQTSGGDREALRAVRNAVKAVESANSNLIAQLQLAKQENDTLSEVVSQKTDFSGGYDFILAQNQGMRLDKTTLVAFGGDGGSGLYRATLSSRDGSVDKNLRAGGSIPYVSADGLQCRVALSSVRKTADSYAASFSNLCDENSKAEAAASPKAT